MKTKSRFALGTLVGSLVAVGCGSRERTPNPTASGGSSSTSGGASAAGGSSTGKGGSSIGGGGEGPALPVEQDLRTAIANLETDVPFTLMLGNEDGIFFVESQEGSTPSTLYRSASTSKWVTAVVALSLVEKGELDLLDRPGDHISWWTTEGSDWRAGITLEQLLAFTSGLQEPAAGAALCTNLPNQDFETCAQNIYARRATHDVTPGTDFVYGSHHMHVAGLMAAEAADALSWEEVFNQFKVATGLFAASAYDLPSATNPRLAGGMHWTGENYMEFLGQLYRGELLTDDLREDLFEDRTPTAQVTLVESPIDEAANQTWHYALGNWIECPQAEWTSACSKRDRYSSPGAFGAYPFIDFRKGFYGLIAREGVLGTANEGLTVYTTLEPLIDELVTGLTN